MKDFFGVAEAAHFAVLYSQADNALSARLADYAFVIRSSADIEAFRDAELQAAHTGVDLLTALFTAGQISPERYTRWLAMALDIPSATYDIRIDADVAQAALEPSGQVKTPISGFWHGVPAIIVNATDAHPQTVKLRVYDAQRHGMPVVLIAGRPLLSAIERACARSNLRTATTGLKRQLPLFSASRAAPQWQPFSAILIVGLIIGAAYMMPHATLSFLIILLTVPFSGVVFIRLYALISMLRAPPAMRSRSGRGHPPGAVVVNDRDLPHYSVMVALYDEAEVLPHLVTALSRLDYPAAKLDCMLVIEELDFATKAALLNLELPTFMRVVVVPDGKPRTKPRALNYALQLAHGDYVVIYDAEDRPEPDQLRRAFAAFAAASSVNERTGELACVQACLNIFNVRQSWLTRQFTVEYSALFDGVLPALQNLNLPMPLGGTSNHFPRAVLAELYGWDPYNVTEDADLGIRLARLGYRVGVISSTTWEEAPPTFNLWLKQRTRWLKGWMQTYLVHTRQPRALLRDLGFLRTLGFHLYLGGMILSMLVHPLFYAAVAASFAFDIQAESLGDKLGPALWYLAVVNLTVGYLASIVVGIIAVRRRGHGLTLSALLMPLYWLLISLAAYRALWQLHSNPFLWEKTPHGLAKED